jgi:hypothetical protein
MPGGASARDNLGSDNLDSPDLDTVGCANKLAERSASARPDTSSCFPASKHMPGKIMPLKKAPAFAHQAYAILMFLY